MRGRAFRRHQLEKKKRKARKVFPEDKYATNANHLKDCSCHMCGNPRKYFGEKTIQERRAPTE